MTRPALASRIEQAARDLSRGDYDALARRADALARQFKQALAADDADEVNDAARLADAARQRHAARCVVALVSLATGFDGSGAVQAA